MGYTRQLQTTLLSAIISVDSYVFLQTNLNNYAVIQSKRTHIAEITGPVSGFTLSSQTQVNYQLEFLVFQNF